MADRSGKEVVRVWYCYGIIMVQLTLTHSFTQ